MLGLMFSISQASAFVLFPSLWYAEMAVPQRKPGGAARFCVTETASLGSTGSAVAATAVPISSRRVIAGEVRLGLLGRKGCGYSPAAALNGVGSIALATSRSAWTKP